jgi:hypothetical protein
MGYRTFLKQTGLDMTEEGDISRICEEVALLFAVQSKPGLVGRNSFSKHEVCNGKKRALCISICTMNEYLAGLSPRFRVSHDRIGVMVWCLRRLIWVGKIVYPSDGVDKVFHFASVAGGKDNRPR